MAQPQQRPAKGVVRFYNFLPEGDSFLDDVLTGLARPQKTLPPKYFYDARGCELFERICTLPEYYPTRTELALMREHAGAMATFLGPDCQLIEFGSGSSTKTRILIEQLQPPLYLPIDIAGEAIREAAAGLARAFPWLNINGVCADYTGPLTLPEFAGVPIRRKAVYFPGSTIGNFTPHESVEFLKRARRMVGPGGALLIGVDLKKDKRLLDAAYDDAAGVTAAFNLNLLVRINRELGGDFQLRRFRHKAFYDEAKGRIEMHLESLASQFAHVGGERFRFSAGETIHTEISCKYGIEEFQAVAQRAGFAPEQTWIDAAKRFSVHGMIAV
ncbi:MAG: L-histidine N(alpha)-methyltransferase [Betaproteobacteria bacterium]|nr:L-histidine N(alpha)-methyltransferase [Betaproteobacteria bacterium]